MAETNSPESDSTQISRIAKALKRRRGRATAADVVVDTAIPSIEVDRLLRQMVSDYPCHLDVTEDGEILYSFEPAMRRFDQRGRLKRRLHSIGRRLWVAFSKFMKALIAIVMVVYVVLFTVLAIAAMVAAASRGGSRRTYRPSHRGGGGNLFFWYWLFGRPGTRYRSHSYRNPSYGRYGRSKTVKDQRPFYLKVFSFVLGPETQDVRPLVDEAALLTFIRKRRGVVTTADIAAHTGWSLTESEHALTQLMAPFDGNIVVTDDGELVFTFPGLLRTAGSTDTKPLPKYWARWERRLPITGNMSGSNLLIAALNSFNLVLALITPSTIMVQLEIRATTLTLVGLSWFPLVFSSLVFLIPAARWLFSVRRENRGRVERNVRRGVYAHVFGRVTGDRSLRIDPGRAADTSVKGLPEWVEKKIPPTISARVTEKALVALGGQPDVSVDGDTVWDCTALRDTLTAGRSVRQRSTDDDTELRLVFSTRDGDDQALEAEIETAQRERAEAVLH